MYKNIVRPFLFRFNTDTVHESTIHWAEKVASSPFLKRLAKGLYDFQHPSLRQEVLGMTFRNPVGLAAGFDKNGTLAPAMEAIGFGFVEVGSITANPSTGNPKPRSFRLPDDESLINRMGLNNDGAATIRRRLEKLSLSIPLGVNIAKTHDPAIAGTQALDDYLESFRIAVPIADYITLNISCPNTREGKTFEDPESLEQLLRHLEVGSNSAHPPLFLKLSSDLDTGRLRELLNVATSNSVSGYVAVNTSNRRTGLVHDREGLQKIGAGGLSGKAIREESNRVIRTIYEETRGEKPIIGVGGIFSAEDALEKIRLGADLLQVYTGLVYEGPGLVKKINRGLHSYLGKNGLDHIYQVRSGSPSSGT